MYEDKTYQSLLEEGLGYITDNILKGEGAFVYNPISVLAFELEKIYRQLDYLRRQLDPETADYDSLLLMAKARGIYPIEATAAQFKMTADGEVYIGARFALQGYTFAVTEPGSGYYAITCTSTGAAPNGLRGTLTPVDYISGLTHAEITDVLTAGRNAETHAELLERYLASFLVQAFGGNRTDYMQHLAAMEGVGGCRVFPCWKGPTTVRCVLIGSDYGPIAAETIAKIQQEMCPVPLKGYGIAPIGHDVTVESAKGIAVNVEAAITYTDGHNSADSLDGVKAAIKEYLLSVRREWGEAESEDEKTVVYIKRIEAAILTSKNVVDIQGTKLNGGEDNLTLEANEIPIDGTITESGEG